MPIYEYRCAACGHGMEVLHAIGGPGPAACELCGGAMRKLMSTPAIHFKGSGWAKKDAASAARSATPGAAATKDDGAAGAAPDAAAGADEAKSEPKPKPAEPAKSAGSEASVPTTSAGKAG
jgi:putative FmdB family regulatory protein